MTCCNVCFQWKSLTAASKTILLQFHGLFRQHRFQKMALRGFSGFEQMFRAKMAKTTPTNVIVVKKVRDGLSDDEKKAYLETFKKFDTDGGGAMDSSELGKLIRVLG